MVMQDNPFGRRGSYGGGTLMSRAAPSDPGERLKRQLKQLEQRRFALNAEINVFRQRIGLPQEKAIFLSEGDPEPEQEIDKFVKKASPFDGQPPEVVLKWLIDYGLSKKKIYLVEKYLKAAYEGQ